MKNTKLEHTKCKKIKIEGPKCIFMHLLNNKLVEEVVIFCQCQF
jgi:hypothetical protein